MCLAPCFLLCFMHGRAIRAAILICFEAGSHGSIPVCSRLTGWLFIGRIVSIEHAF